MGRRLHLPHLAPLALFMMYPPLNLDHAIKTTLTFQGWNSLDLVGCADVAAVVNMTSNLLHLIGMRTSLGAIETQLRNFGVQPSILPLHPGLAADGKQYCMHPVSSGRSNAIYASSFSIATFLHRKASQKFLCLTKRQAWQQFALSSVFQEFIQGRRLLQGLQ